GPGAERWIVLEPLELTVDPDRGRGARRQVKVRAVQIEEPAEQLRNGDLHVLIGRGNRAHRHFTTLATSSSDVMPMRAFSSPSSRSVIIPCCTATALIASAEERSTVSRSISSLICITSYRPIRPRYPVLAHAGHPCDFRSSGISGHSHSGKPAASSSAGSGLYW